MLRALSAIGLRAVLVGHMPKTVLVLTFACAAHSTSFAGFSDAIFHSDVERNSGGAAGGHGWSADGGATWTFSAFNAFNRTVELKNGTSISLRQRERPHLVFDDKGSPIVLTNGAGWVDDCDHVFTFAQPINSQRSP